VVLAACGGSSQRSGTASSPDTRPELTMITFSDTSALLPGQPQRVTIGFADKDGVVLSDPPTKDPIVFTVESNGQRVGDPMTVEAHAAGIPKAYYPIVFNPPAVGQKMIPFDTPTVADPRGVELLCTRNPQCPLHDITLREALAAGVPVAFLIATPQFCQQAICGPVLDVLLGQKDAFPGVKMLHSEVYPTVADAQPNALKVTEVVSAYGLTFEPALYLAATDGTIVNRLDTIFDEAELHDALAKLAS
jgi:hypothetical protein